MKIILTAAITAAICFAFTAATGFASHNDNAYFHTMKPGDTAWFPALDLTCVYGNTGGASNRPVRTQKPSQIYCSTYSHATAGVRPSHYAVWSGLDADDQGGGGSYARFTVECFQDY